jgi:hypothetical protein
MNHISFDEVVNNYYLFPHKQVGYSAPTMSLRVSAFAQLPFGDRFADPLFSLYT